MIHIDGSQGEGGGQILRSALALSLVTGKSFRMEKIRAGRERPGLLRQHLTAVNASAQVGGAKVEGDRIGSRELTFVPETVRPGCYHFSVGTAGSCILVLQTILPALILAEGPCDLLLEGGTHNSAAPTFDFLARTFLPLLERMGPKVTAVLERPGFYPSGGGRFRARVDPVGKLVPLHLPDGGSILGRKARAVVAGLPRHVAERELRMVRRLLFWEEEWMEVEELPSSLGPGNVLSLEIESEQVTEVFSGFGERGVRAEVVAKRAVEEVREYLEAGVPVGRHLADQLLLPLALAGGGSFRTLSPSTHFTTNLEVLKMFLELEVQVLPFGSGRWEVRVEGPGLSG